jgi:hypothetical protein
VVPISLIGTFAAFAALGFSINTLTLFGLVLAIGIVVDDAIGWWKPWQRDSGRSHRSKPPEAMADVGGPVIAIPGAGSRVRAGGVLGVLPVALQAIRVDTRHFRDSVGDLRVDLHAPHVRCFCAKWRPPARVDAAAQLVFAKFTAASSTRDAYIGSVTVMARHTLLVVLTFGVLRLGCGD